MQNKYKINFKIWLESPTGESLLGEGKIKLLKAIRETECLTEATKILGWSYRTTWNNLKALEKKLGFPLFEVHRGGEGGGGKTVLTAEALELLDFVDESYRKIQEKIFELIN